MDIFNKPIVFNQNKLEETSALFHSFLHQEEDGEVARSFLWEQRGIDHERLIPYEVGFCPIDFFYPSHTARKTIDGHGWFIRGRLTVTIRDQYGQILGFAGRIIEDCKSSLRQIVDDQFGADYDVDEMMEFWDAAKWINEFYKKERYLYNLHRAKKAIFDNGFAIIVEGYMDAILLDMMGVHNVVAVCGSAFSDLQAGLIRRYANRLVFCFDGDEAGIKASLKGAQGCEGARFTDHSPDIKESDVDILDWWTLVKLPQGKDPEDMLRTSKSEAELLVETLQFVGKELTNDRQTISLDPIDGMGARMAHRRRKLQLGGRVDVEYNV